MINRQSTRVRKYATRQMLCNDSKHAIYGLSYVTPSGLVVEEVAENPSKIKYFYSDDSYCIYVDTIHEHYEGVDVLAVHRIDYMP